MLHLSSESNDLSRRVRLNSLPIMSLREYIELETGIALPSIAFDDLVYNHLNISTEIINQLPRKNIFG